MPLFTPSRLLVIVVSFLLFTFLWTWGTPSPLPAPPFPAGQHGGPQQPAHPVEKPAPGVDGSQPQEPANKEHTTSSFFESLVPSSTTLTPTPSPSLALKESLSTTETVEKSAEQEQGGHKTLDSPQPAATGLAGGSSTESEAQISTTPTPSTSQPAESPKGTDVHKENGTSEGANTTLITVTSSAASISSTVVESPSKETPPVHEKFCNKVKGAPHIMVVIKTSKGEIEDKLPAHLQTLLTCVPNFAIFSDHSGEIQGHKVHNVLESISDTMKDQHDEFKDYKKLQAGIGHSGPVNKDLDKWKFLPMVYQAYKMNMNSRFFIFIEADTSLSWTNTLQWIDRLDYRIPYYSGAPTFMGDVKFAQRGSGIFISQGAMRLYDKAYKEKYHSKWESRVGRECCGDMVLATAMADANVEFYSAFPLLQGENPTSLDWTDRHWCAPMVSWHHMAPNSIKMVWDAERNWTSKKGWAEPYLYRDAFVEFIEPKLTDMVTEWDNISADSKIVKPPGANESDPSSDWAKYSEDLRKSVESPKACARVCELADDCLQWKHSTNGEGECYSGKVIRLGHRVAKKDGEQTWTSGWMLDKIKKRKVDWECSKGPKWKFNQ